MAITYDPTEVKFRVLRDAPANMQRLSESVVVHDPSNLEGSIDLDLEHADQGITIPATCTEGTPFTITLDPTQIAGTGRFSPGVRSILTNRISLDGELTIPVVTIIESGPPARR